MNVNFTKTLETIIFSYLLHHIIRYRNTDIQIYTSSQDTYGLTTGAHNLLQSLNHKQLSWHLNCQSWTGYTQSQFIRRQQAARIHYVLQELLQFNLGRPQIVCWQIVPQIFNHVGSRDLTDVSVERHFEELINQRKFDKWAELQGLKVSLVLSEFLQTFIQLMQCADCTNLTTNRFIIIAYCTLLDTHTEWSHNQQLLSQT